MYLLLEGLTPVKKWFLFYTVTYQSTTTFEIEMFYRIFLFTL